VNINHHAQSLYGTAAGCFSEYESLSFDEESFLRK
jgi:hypothetical protein